MQVISKPSQGNLLGVGRHLVELTDIKPTTAKTHDDYKDAMPQFAIKFEDGNGKSITLFANTYGVKRFTELSEKDQQSGKFVRGGDADYAIDVKTGQRVKDDSRTEKCMSILGALAHSCGTPKGEPVELGALVGSKLGIQVEENDRGNLRVAYTVPASQAQATAEEAVV
jgi:hypothetical protein